MHRGAADDLTYGAHDREQSKKIEATRKPQYRQVGKLAKKSFSFSLI